MKLKQIHYFVSLAETLSFTRTSEQCHVTQPAISHQIKHLEEELNTTLFLRSGNNVFLTDAGRRLYADLAPILQQIRTTVKKFKTNKFTHLSIGATHTFSIHIAPTCMSEFLTTHPTVEISMLELAQAQVVKQLLTNQIDLGIGYQPNTNKLHFEPVYAEELFLAVAKTHPFSGHTQLAMAELNGLRVTLLPKRFHTRQLLDQLFSEAAVVPKIAAEQDSISSMLDLIYRSDVAGFIGELSIKKDPNIIYIPIIEPCPIRITGFLRKVNSDHEVKTELEDFANIVRRFTNV